MFCLQLHAGFLKIKRFLHSKVFILILCVFILNTKIQAENNLKIFDELYPRNAFFRNSEFTIRNGGMGYDSWLRNFSSLQGIMGKTEAEELEANLEILNYFRRFKENNPNQLVIIHFNGNGRLPTYNSYAFFPGHWLYYAGTMITSDIPQQNAETVVSVKDASFFLMEGGLSKNKGDDIVLTELGADGTPDWNKVEQVVLLSVNTNNNTIRIKRGQYGTSPRAFKANQTYGAAHVTEGPWENKDYGMLWAYNYSTVCPKDQNGKTCRDVLVDQLGSYFSKDGKWSNLDGIQFDVMPSEINLDMNQNHKVAGHKPDCDGDGIGDGGIFNKVNQYGIGAFLFLSELREKLPSNKFILADGQGAAQQRTYGILNGTEQEGFPNNAPRNFLRWSMGLNMFRFWNAASVSPKLVYTAEKRIIPTGSTLPEFPANWHRLVQAAAVFENAAVFNSYCPEGNAGVPTVRDEMTNGVARETNWLGKPIGEAVYLAEHSADELMGSGKPVRNTLLNRLDFKNKANSQIQEDVLKIEATDAGASSVVFRVKNISFKNRQTYLAFEAKADPMRNYPAKYNRSISVSVNGKQFPLRMECFLNQDWVKYKYYFCNTYDPLTNQEYVHATTDIVDIEIDVEGSEAFYLRNISAHNAPEIVYREFENGLVIANLSESAYEFDLAGLFPGKKFKRINGKLCENRMINNGRKVEEKILIRPKDAIFLNKTDNL